MSWDFETEPEFQKELDWIDKFVREEVEPLDYRARSRPTTSAMPIATSWYARCRPRSASASSGPAISSPNWAARATARSSLR